MLDQDAIHARAGSGSCDNKNTGASLFAFQLYTAKMPVKIRITHSIKLCHHFFLQNVFGHAAGENISIFNQYRYVTSFNRKIDVMERGNYSDAFFPG